jgi:hypothetical protein
VGAGANDGIDFDTDYDMDYDTDVSIHDGAKANAAGTLASGIEDTDVFARFGTSLDNRDHFIFNDIDCRELRPPSI